MCFEKGDVLHVKFVCWRSTKMLKDDIEYYDGEAIALIGYEEGCRNKTWGMSSRNIEPTFNMYWFFMKKTGEIVFVHFSTLYAQEIASAGWFERTISKRISTAA